MLQLNKMNFYNCNHINSEDSLNEPEKFIKKIKKKFIK